jgi:hypothetical protein
MQVRCCNKTGKLQTRVKLERMKIKRREAKERKKERKKADVIRRNSEG